MDENPDPLGVVPIDGRGSLPFALVHGESLVAVAQAIESQTSIR